ncbi:GNAT family N-acetyltransferase [Paenactinomyces guangxiensis]|uniref:GNAT family N-acetyltransferase n=2 Tax=Paenactinomyces guangxiensis TaxID=1490290 RepID=A0A7W1WRW1_9BACL|nr:GNAT family protein [Paenactinomyces guangxiensis]MBA4494935.1 GNAT family N-acetyltransferase [Paenactinomyces guangxiensis]MBH8592018.1 GNAT family N-acetyltransferase [Paenactinomyces guangxiensis]
MNDAIDISNWQYEDPYSFYNLDGSLESIDEIMNGTYYSVRNENNELMGFFCFGSSAQVPSGIEVGVYLGDNAVDIGLGLKPNLTGQGLGLSFLQSGLDFAKNKFKPRIIRLSVATFNQRAITVYTRAGFKLGTKFLHKGTEFAIMQYDVQ